MNEVVARFHSGGRELAVRQLGRGRRITVLHGGPGLDHHVLLPLARSLASRFEVWLPDLPGHGASPPEDGTRPGLRSTLSILEGWLSSLPGGPGILVAHSLAAWLVTRLLRGDRLRPVATVLLCPLALPRTRGDRHAFPPPPSGRGVDPGVLDVLRSHIEAECGGNMPESAADPLRGARLTPVAAHAELSRVLDAEMTHRADPFDPPCPVLIAAGERDRTTPLTHAREAARIVRGARIVVFPDRGHYPFLEDPDLVAKTVAEFADRAVAPRAQPSRRATT